MNTRHLSTSNEDLLLAAHLLQQGGLVAFPTETVYGLGACATNAKAVQKIFEAKGRPADNPLIVHVSCWEDVSKVCCNIPSVARRLAEKFWPGPLTMLLPKQFVIPDITTAGLSTVGVRCPSNEIARKLIQLTGIPIAAPSANRSGRPSPTEFTHLVQDLEGRVDALIDGGSCQVGVESTVLDVTVSPPRLLRPGGVSLNALQAVLGDVQVDDAVLSELSPDAKVRSPGMKYRHYAPSAPVIILRGSVKDAAAFVARKAKKGLRCAVLCYQEEISFFQKASQCLSYGSQNDAQSLNHNLFSALRTMDTWNPDVIYARCPEGNSETMAVENRLKRAAGFRILSLQSPCIVGLTGGSGAGKTYVLNALRRRGAFTLDADELYHDLLNNNLLLKKELFQRFPSCITEAGIDRSILSQIVFNDDQALHDLNTITHKHILSTIRERFIQAGRDGFSIVVLDAPTLFESGFYLECHYLIAVIAPEHIRLQRIVDRDGISQEKALLRIRHQHSNDFFYQNCDFIVENDGFNQVEPQLDLIWNTLGGNQNE